MSDDAAAPPGDEPDDHDPLDEALPEQTDEDALERAWEDADVEEGEAPTG